MIRQSSLGKFDGVTRYNNLETVTYRNGTVSGKTDFHVDISKSPRGEFLFPR